MIDAQRLREQGYLPLPVQQGAKYCHLVGWPSMQWKGTAPGVGLNLRGLVMVDIDVDDAETAHQIKDCVLRDLPTASAIPIRSRANSARIAVLLALSHEDQDVHLRFSSRTYQDGRGVKHRVEFKMGSGEFMFAFGTHPSGAALKWSLAGTDQSVCENSFPPPEDLHRSSVRRLRLLLEEIDQILEASFGMPVAPPTTFDPDAPLQFDLRWDMVFNLPDGGRASLEDLWEGETTAAFVHLTPWRPDSDSGGGHLMNHPQWGPMVTDFVTGTRHVLPPVDADFHLPEGMEMPSFRSPEEIEEEESELAKEVARLRRLVFVRSEGRFIYDNDPDPRLMTPAGALYGLDKESRASWLKMIPAVDDLTWDPGRPALAPFADASGTVRFNLFSLPDHPAEGGTTAPFAKFMARMLPCPAERAIVWKWMAHKVQRPIDRCFALVLVGGQGSGKGTLWKDTRPTVGRPPRIERARRTRDLRRSVPGCVVAQDVCAHR